MGSYSRPGFLSKKFLLLCIPAFFTLMSFLNYHSQDYSMTPSSTSAKQVLQPNQTVVQQISKPQFQPTDHNEFGLDRSACEEFLRTGKQSRHGRPMMMPVDIKTFNHYLGKIKQEKPNMLYVEWGSGGSTFVALNYATHVISFENDIEWCKVMKQDKILQCNVAIGKLQFICPNGGKTMGFGHPANLSEYNSLVYINALQGLNYEPDFVFVDGRFRVASALASTKHSKTDSIMLLHDYYDRPKYWAVEKYFKNESTYVRKTGNMGVFRKRPDIDMISLESDIEKYKTQV